MNGNCASVSDAPAIALAPSAATALIAFAGEPKPGRSGGRVPRPVPNNHYQPMLLALIPVCLGIWFDRYLLAGVPHSFAVQWATSLIAIIVWRWFWKSSRNLLAMASLCVAIAAAAGAWHDLHRNYFAEDEIGRYASEAPQPVCCEAVAVGAPEQMPAPAFDPLRPAPLSPQTRLWVDVVALREGGHWQSASGRARLTIGSDRVPIHAGDRLRIFGNLSAPSPAANPGDFDYAEFARDERQLSLLRVKGNDGIQLIAAASAWNPARWLDALRQGGTRVLEEFLPREHAGLASAILLGEREYVDEDTNEAFLETGTIHILCIAGLHIGMVATLLFVIFGAGWLPRRAAIVCVMGILGAYMLLTMSRPPVMRATLLVWIFCGGMLLGRRSWGWNSLALAALIVLAVNPSSLTHTGVQLSFLSVAAILWVAPKLLSSTSENVDPLDRLIAMTRSWPQRALMASRHHLWEMFVIGLAMWIIITPLVMARFHILSPVGLILNLLLIPVLAIIVASGMGVLVFGWWLPPVAGLFGWFCNLSLAILENTVKWAAALPGARFWVAGPSEIWLAVFYLAVAIAMFGRWPPLRWQAALLGGWCAVGLLGAVWLHSPGDTLRCSFVAVGHGGAALVELPDGRSLLYDAGRLGSPSGGAQSISHYLWSRGINHVDAVVLSHADTDHYNALPELLERFSVGVVYVSPVMFKQETPALKILRESIEHAGVAIQDIYAGDRLLGGHDVAIDVLHPPPEGMPGRDNASSVVLAVQYAGNRILLTGDLEPPGSQALMNELPLHYDVILAPHHGSAYSVPEAMVRWATPNYVVVAGRFDDGRASRPIYEAHGATVLNTAERGAISVTISPDRFAVDCFHPAPINRN